jgi:predicted acyl esterase
MEMCGISYPGFYATYSLLSNHPALKAVSPQACISDFFLMIFITMALIY